MSFDPRTLDLDRFFRDPSMFDSRDAWRAAGFSVFDRGDSNKVMVAHHRSVKGYLFKKYARTSSKSDHEDNYQRRIEGADRVRALIAKRDLRGVVVPGKGLHELPSSFGRSDHVLVVDELPLLDDEATKRAYGDISKDTLHDLCVVLHKFRGLDSIAKNLPFTKDGRIAFIDTEHWDRHADRKLKLHIGSQLSSKSLRLAEKLIDKLDDD